MTQDENVARYGLAMHAMQSGVAAKMNYDGAETSPKHLRVGVNSAMLEHAALVKLLVEKGVFTWEEYTAAQADAAEAEVKLYEEWLSERTGANVRLS